MQGETVKFKNEIYKANQFRLDCLGVFSFDQGCTNSGRQFARATTFCMVTPDIYGSSLRNLRHATLFAILILMCFMDFWKTWAPCTEIFPVHHASNDFQSLTSWSRNIYLVTPVWIRVRNTLTSTDTSYRGIHQRTLF